MNDIQAKVMAKMPSHLFKFLDTLDPIELEELSRVDKQLIAKIYQAGAVFAIEATLEIKDEGANHADQ